MYLFISDLLPNESFALLHFFNEKYLTSIRNVHQLQEIKCMNFKIKLGSKILIHLQGTAYYGTLLFNVKLEYLEKWNIEKYLKKKNNNSFKFSRGAQLFLVILTNLILPVSDISFELPQINSRIWLKVILAIL